nr:hypothetical protein [Tanacetum cinerariifolium]
LVKVASLPVDVYNKYAGNNHFTQAYILGLDDDERKRLLVVIRKTEDSLCGKIYRTWCFQIFEYDLETRKWSEVKDLGNKTLFVGYNSSFWIKDTTSMIKGNCVYFTDEVLEWTFKTVCLTEDKKNIGGCWRRRVAVADLPYKGTEREKVKIRVTWTFKTVCLTEDKKNIGGCWRRRVAVVLIKRQVETELMLEEKFKDLCDEVSNFVKEIKDMVKEVERLSCKDVVKETVCFLKCTQKHELYMMTRLQMMADESHLSVHEAYLWMLVYCDRDNARDLEFRKGLDNLWVELLERINERQLFITKLEGLCPSSKREINADLQFAVGLSQLWDVLYHQVNEIKMLSSELNLFRCPLAVQCATYLKQLSKKMDLFDFIHHADPTKEDQSEGKDHVSQDKPATILVDEKYLKCGGWFTAMATVPFVTSFVTPTAEHKGSGDTDSISGLNLRTQRPSERSFVLPPLVMTVSVTTTVIAGASSVPIIRLDVELVTKVYQSPFVNSTSIEMDSETLRQIYVPKCNVVNESVLDDSNLFYEFNVGAARQTCVVAEVRMWSEHNLRERKRFKRRCVRQDGQLKELSDRVAGLDSKLMALALHLDKEFYPRFLTTIVGRQWIIGIQAGLVAGIDHGKSRRVLAVLESLKDTSIADIMNSLCLEGPSTETLETFGNATTALSISITAINVSSIPPILVANYDVLDAGIQDEVPNSSKSVFEKKNLETIPEHPSVS